MADKEFSLPEVDSIDEVPEDFRPFYFEKNGKVERQNPQAMVSTMAKIRRENEKLSSEVLSAQNELDAYREALGDDADPAVIKALKDKAARADNMPTNDEVEKRIRLVEENAKKQAEILQGEKQKLQTTIEKEAIAVKIQSALQAVDANKDGLEMLPQLYRTRVETQYLDDGTIKLIPLDADGSRMYNADGSEASLVDFANKIKEERPIFFNALPGSGLNSTGETVTLPKDAKDWYKMTPAEKAEFRRKHGPQAATALMIKSVKTS